MGLYVDIWAIQRQPSFGGFLTHSKVLTLLLSSLNLLVYCLCTTQPTDRTFTSITSLCLPPQLAQNNPSLSSHYSSVSSNSVTLLYKEAGTGLKQDRMRKTRCDREKGFTKDRKHKDMSERAGGRDEGSDRRRRAERGRDLGKVRWYMRGKERSEWVRKKRGRI